MQNNANNMNYATSANTCLILVVFIPQLSLVCTMCCVYALRVNIFKTKLYNMFSYYIICIFFFYLIDINLFFLHNLQSESITYEIFCNCAPFMFYRIQKRNL